MRRMIGMILVAAMIAACGSSDGGPSSHDPYAIVWVRNQLSAGAASDTFYRVFFVKVNAGNYKAEVGDVNRGEQRCVSYAGFPDDSLDIQVWLQGYYGADTLKSTTFMPLTGPTPDSAAHWGVFFTDTGVIVKENPDSFPASCRF